MATTSRGYPLFSGTDQPNGPAQMGALAQAIDADMNATVSGVWTPYTPLLKNDATGLSVSITVNDARYLLIGNTCRVQVSVTANAACNSAGVTLPFTSKVRVLNCGTAGIFGTGAPTGQTGIAYMTSDKAKVVCVNYSQNFQDMVAGQVLRADVVYERA